MSQQFSLKGSGSLTVLHFLPLEDKVRVVGITGAVGYFDRDMGKEEARNLYKEYKEANWKAVEPSTVPSVESLRFHIYN